MAAPFRIAHISDIHVWRMTWNPRLWFGKRALGLGNLLLRRGRKFKRNELPRLLEAIREDRADHLILSGDLTTTSLPSEFLEVKAALSEWLHDPDKATILPGNHDRYTQASYRKRLFDTHFGDFCEGSRFPFYKDLSDGLALIGFDPNIPRPLSARGLVKIKDLKQLRPLLDRLRDSKARALLFVCHYPGQSPPEHAAREKGHELVGAHQLVQALSEIEIPTYWLHGHIHHPWEYQSPNAPHLTYLNPGAPLYNGYAGISLGRWILDWDGESLTREWRSLPEAARYLAHS